MDNEYPDGVKAGSLYGMVYPEEDMSKPVGEWNSYLITIDYKNNFGNVIFNGKEVVNFPVEGEEWDSMVAGTKFANCDEKPWIIVSLENLSLENMFTRSWRINLF